MTSNIYNTKLENKRYCEHRVYGNTQIINIKGGDSEVAIKNEIELYLREQSGKCLQRAAWNTVFVAAKLIPNEATFIASNTIHNTVDGFYNKGVYVFKMSAEMISWLTEK